MHVREINSLAREAATWVWEAVMGSREASDDDDEVHGEDEMTKDDRSNPGKVKYEIQGRLRGMRRRGQAEEVARQRWMD